MINYGIVVKSNTFGKKIKQYMETYYELINGENFFIYTDKNGETHYIISNDDEDDEYDSCRCGNLENNRY